MSQLPYIAIDSKINNLTIENKVFSGTGQVVAPFNMYEVTNDIKFYDFQQNEHIFVSLLPLYNDNFYLFYLKSNLVSSHNNIYLQDMFLTDEISDFTFYYSITSKPLNIASINLNFKVMPLTYPSRQIRTGKIDKVKISTYNEYMGVMDIDSFSDDTILTSEIIKEVLKDE